MRTRVVAAAALAIALSAGPAAASSILALEPAAPASTPSMIVLPALETAAPPPEKTRGYQPSPLVIRGGLAGAPFVRALPAQPEPASAQPEPGDAQPLPRSVSRPE
ncbi:hypothetical protein [Chelativorans intermedius]|uniref:Uncharacterized protein n=1 Tax=Chelativorans intermedius TaxID=515947 RepID=A0ABV6DA45_9HYPH|nr:hypothetical protein [Chelativorans intermedius]MCT8998618.1 hypothetical protein [Chelativorans intermedius]